jgi:hypothetical protein
MNSGNKSSFRVLSLSEDGLAGVGGLEGYLVPGCLVKHGFFEIAVLKRRFLECCHDKTGIIEVRVIKRGVSREETIKIVMQKIGIFEGRVVHMNPGETAKLDVGVFQGTL